LSIEVYNDTLYVDFCLPVGYKIISGKYKVTIPVNDYPLDYREADGTGIRLYNIVLIPTRRVPLEAANLEG
jgi:hypothetical protein